MTRAELDQLWSQATAESIAAGEMYTRYRFAEKLLAAELQKSFGVYKAWSEEAFRAVVNQKRELEASLAQMAGTISAQQELLARAAAAAAPPTFFIAAPGEAQARRKPLTPAEMDAVTRDAADALLDYINEWGSAKGAEPILRAIGRAVETAHGIKE